MASSPGCKENDFLPAHSDILFPLGGLQLAAGHRDFLLNVEKSDFNGKLLLTSNSVCEIL